MNFPPSAPLPVNRIPYTTLFRSSYRNYPAFNEQIVNRITDDLVAAISPRWLKVEGRFSPRGGIQLTATAEHNPENRPL